MALGGTKESPKVEGYEELKTALKNQKADIYLAKAKDLKRQAVKRYAIRDWDRVSASDVEGQIRIAREMNRVVEALEKLGDDGSSQLDAVKTMLDGFNTGLSKKLGNGIRERIKAGSYTKLGLDGGKAQAKASGYQDRIRKVNELDRQLDQLNVALGGTADHPKLEDYVTHKTTLKNQKADIYLAKAKDLKGQAVKRYAIRDWDRVSASDVEGQIRIAREMNRVVNELENLGDDGSSQLGAVKTMRDAFNTGLSKKLGNRIQKLKKTGRFFGGKAQAKASGYQDRIRTVNELDKQLDELYTFLGRTEDDDDDFD